jgi:uncharacterized membrane protein
LHDLSITAYAILPSCSTVANLIGIIAFLVVIAIIVVSLISSIRKRTLEPFIYIVIFFAFVVVVALLPTKYQKQVEKPEGGNVFWLGKHWAIELFSDDAEVTGYGPYCD